MRGLWLTWKRCATDDTASISSALLYLAPALSTPEHAVTTWDKSVITSATSFGALGGGLVAGVCADRWGRRAVIWIADLLFIAGAIWQAAAMGVWSMVAGRVVVGVGVGVGSLVVPLYISELAPASHRGRLVVISVLCITCGQLGAYAAGLLLGERWRWILGLGAVPAGIQALLMVMMPETPRWQLQRGRRKAAAETLARVYGTPDITSVLSEIEAGVRTGPAPTLRSTLESLLRVPGNRRALTLACFLQFLQQACGFNALMYFSATIFAGIGFRSPTAVAMVVAGTNAAGAAFAFHLIDRVGRRRMLLVSLAGMSAGLSLCALGFLALPDLTTSGLPAHPDGLPTLPAAVIVASIIAFVAFYAAGLGAVPWLCQSEFFAMSVRGVGTGAATATNWGWNLVVAATFLGVVEHLGASVAFAAYAAVCAVGWAICWRIYPETGGLPMEEVERVLRDGWGV